MHQNLVRRGNAVDQYAAAAATVILFNGLPIKSFLKNMDLASGTRQNEAWLMNFDQFDRYIASWMEKYGVRILRIALATIFIWFGLLKPLGLSPAAELVKNTVYWLPPDVFLPILGWWEVLIGVFLLYRPTIRASLFLLFLQMPGTMLPLILLPDVCFTKIPFGLTIEGQYIIKNLVLIGSAIVVGGTVRRKSSATKRL